MTVLSEQGQENGPVERGKVVKSGNVGVADCSSELSLLLLVLTDTTNSTFVSDKLIRTRVSRRFIFALIICRNEYARS